MTHDSARATRHERMSRLQRSAIYLIVGLLWMTGCLWLYMDHVLAQRGEFGVTPHPLEPPVLLLHGVVAVLSMFLFGWITALHVLHWWPRGLRRMSGGSFAASLIVLSMSGFALFFLVDETPRRVAALIHDALGLVSIVFALQHWFFFLRTRGAKRRERRDAHSST